MGVAQAYEKIQRVMRQHAHRKVGWAFSVGRWVLALSCMFMGFLCVKAADEVHESSCSAADLSKCDVGKLIVEFARVEGRRSGGDLVVGVVPKNGSQSRDILYVLTLCHVLAAEPMLCQDLFGDKDQNKLSADRFRLYDRVTRRLTVSSEVDSGEGRLLDVFWFREGDSALNSSSRPENLLDTVILKIEMSGATSSPAITDELVKALDTVRIGDVCSVAGDRRSAASAAQPLYCEGIPIIDPRKGTGAEEFATLRMVGIPRGDTWSAMDELTLLKWDADSRTLVQTGPGPTPQRNHSGLPMLDGFFQPTALAVRVGKIIALDHVLGAVSEKWPQKVPIGQQAGRLYLLNTDKRQTSENTAQPVTGRPYTQLVDVCAEPDRTSTVKLRLRWFDRILRDTPVRVRQDSDGKAGFKPPLPELTTDSEGMVTLAVLKNRKPTGMVGLTVSAPPCRVFNTCGPGEEWVEMGTLKRYHYGCARERALPWILTGAAAAITCKYVWCSSNGSTASPPAGVSLGRPNVGPPGTP